MSELVECMLEERKHLQLAFECKGGGGGEKRVEAI